MSQQEHCHHCARTRPESDPHGLAWMCERGADGSVTWLCDRCARVHLRAIESRLPGDYW